METAALETLVAGLLDDVAGVRRGMSGLEVVGLGLPAHRTLPYGSSEEAARAWAAEFRASVARKAERDAARAATEKGGPSTSQRASKRWDDLYNEGGEGYNPYRHR